eukprot:scaffold522_cov168-Amphora_coffeaeformis.AAC.10
MQTLSFYADIAQDYDFVWVNPEGLQSSFNADSCCGYSMEHAVDDKAFFQNIIHDLSNELDFVSVDWTYAMGWSNGGYMVSYASDLFRAVAPISGYQIETIPIAKPTPIFLHHASDDSFVRPTGCCTDPTMPKCCCRLSDRFDSCMAVETQIYAWAQRNRCSLDTKEQVFDHKGRQVTCRTFHDCQANTTFCMHEGKGHFNRPSFQVAFPMSREIAEFFGRNMCLEGNKEGATWDTAKHVCACPQRDVGPYCLKSQSSEKPNTDVSSQPAIPNQNHKTASESSDDLATRHGLLFAGILCLAVVLLGLFYRSRRLCHRGIAAYRRVPMNIEMGKLEEKQNNSVFVSLPYLCPAALAVVLLPITRRSVDCETTHGVRESRVLAKRDPKKIQQQPPVCCLLDNRHSAVY